MTDQPTPKPLSDLEIAALTNSHAALPKAPYEAAVGNMDAMVRCADGRTYNFGDSLYHPDNQAAAVFFVIAATAMPRLLSEIDASRAECAQLRESLAAAEKQRDEYFQAKLIEWAIRMVAEANKATFKQERDALAAELAEARKVMKRQVEDIDIMQDVLDILSFTTVGPATMDNLGDAGRNEVELRIELADKARRRCHCWKEAEAQAERDQAAEDKALAARDSGKASGGGADAR